MGALLLVNTQTTPITYWTNWLTNGPTSTQCLNGNQLCPTDDGTDYLPGHGPYSGNSDGEHLKVAPGVHYFHRDSNVVSNQSYSWGGSAIYLELNPQCAAGKPARWIERSTADPFDSDRRGDLVQDGKKQLSATADPSVAQPPHEAQRRRFAGIPSTRPRDDKPKQFGVKRDPSTTAANDAASAQDDTRNQLPVAGHRIC
jgi:hypothetical protein